ncbi:MAG: GNAT family N-acetyltransferase [Paracoccaceae bacterium]
MTRRAEDSDSRAWEAYFTRRMATSMFMASNLRDHGLSGTGHGHATAYWIAEANGQIGGVFGCSEAGVLLGDAEAFDPAWTIPLRTALAGRRIIGANGAADVTAAMIAALGLDRQPPSFDDPQPHYHLDQSALVAPPGDTVLRPMTLTDLPLATHWRQAFDREVFGDGDLPEGRSNAERRIRGLIDADRGRILELNGTAVAMTGFNAALPTAVQIGSVYTPPDHRGAGYARRAVALHLQEVAAQGVTTAILFSSGPSANRAYEAIGFTRIGTYRLIDYHPPVLIEAPQ